MQHIANDMVISLMKWQHN